MPSMSRLPIPVFQVQSDTQILTDIERRCNHFDLQPCSAMYSAVLVASWNPAGLSPAPLFPGFTWPERMSVTSATPDPSRNRCAIRDGPGSDDDGIRPFGQHGFCGCNDTRPHLDVQLLDFVQQIAHDVAELGAVGHPYRPHDLPTQLRLFFEQRNLAAAPRRR